MDSKKRYLYFYDSEWLQRPYFLKEKNKNIQQCFLYSIGITKYDTILKEIVDTLYVVIKPDIELKENYFKFNNGTMTEISQGISFEAAYSKVLGFLENNICYAWGGEDLKTLLFNLNYYKSKLPTIKIENIQKQITLKVSPSIKYTKLGLQKLKEICNYNSIVQHNALSDAIDLTLCVKTLFNNEKLNDEVLSDYIEPLKKSIHDNSLIPPVDTPCILIGNCFYKNVSVELKNLNKSKISKIKSLIPKSTFKDTSQTFKVIDDNVHFLNNTVIEKKDDLTFIISYDISNKDLTIKCVGKSINKIWKSFDTNIMRKKFRSIVDITEEENIVMTLTGEKVED